MGARKATIRFGIILEVVGLVFTVQTVVAAEPGEVNYQIKARAISAISIERAAADNIDFRVTRLTPESERQELIKILTEKGNHAVAAALVERDEAGWVRFDPRGGGGPGRDPRKTPFRYAREIVGGDTREFILITNEYIGFGSRGQAANGAKIVNFPLSFVLLKFKKDDKGVWTGAGRMFVGAKIRFDSAGGKFTIDEFPSDPVYLKNMTIK